MPKITAQLELVETDVRAGEIACLLKISNEGSEAFEITELIPRVPDGVILLDVKNSSREAVRSRTNTLLDELSALLSEHLMVESEDFRKRQKQVDVDYIREVVGDSLSGFLAAYFRVFSGAMVKTSQRARERRRALEYKIQSAGDAERCLQDFFPASADGKVSVTRRIFESKLQQLRELGPVQEFSGQRAAVAVVEPNTQFMATYVLSCKRGILNPRSYGFSIEIVSEVNGNSDRYNNEVSRSIVVSPGSGWLSFIAVLSGMLGVALKYSLENESKAPNSPIDFLTGLAGQVATGPGFAAAILALVFFNIFEYTDFAKRLKMGISWRTALTIGVAAGIFGDRFLAAFKAFLGIS